MEYVVLYYLKPQKSQLFRLWLSANAVRLAADLPEGWCYLGTSFGVEGFDCETRWGVTRLEPLASDNLPNFHALTKELAAFIDPILPVEGKFLGGGEEANAL